MQRAAIQNSVGHKSIPGRPHHQTQQPDLPRPLCKLLVNGPSEDTTGLMGQWNSNSRLSLTISEAHLAQRILEVPLGVLSGVVGGVCTSRYASDLDGVFYFLNTKEYRQYSTLRASGAMMRAIMMKRLARATSSNVARVRRPSILMEPFGFQVPLRESMKLQCVLRSGLIVRVQGPADWEIYNEVLVNGEYDVAIAHALDRSSDQEIRIVDLGANVGYFVFRCADLFIQNSAGKNLSIVAVEGAPHAYQDLSNRVDSEALLRGRVRVVHGLIGERTGSAYISDRAVHYGNSIASNPSIGNVRVLHRSYEPGGRR